MDADAVWQLGNQEFLSRIERGAFPNISGKIRFYAPSFRYYKTRSFRSSPASFPSISITGFGCALKCKHCDGRLLKNMHPASTPTELFKLCVNLKDRGALGCLISGGCMPDGSVPLEKFIDTIARIKKELGLTVITHTGIITPSVAMGLKDAAVDAALIDVIGSDETIRDIYQLRVTVEDFDNALKALWETKIPIVPHVLVGLHYGKLKGELRALRIISKYSPSAVVIIAFMPIRSTPLEKVTPPNPEAILKVLVAARLLMPQTPIVLGCMRPKGEHRMRTDILAVKAGVDAIAFPVEEAIRLAESRGLEITYSSLCCSQIFEDVAPHPVKQNEII